MLIGLNGTSAVVNQQDVVVVNAQSVHDTARDGQKVPLEDPREMLITFQAAAGTVGANGNARARIEWGSGGMQFQLPAFTFFEGLTIPIKGSWVRVVLLGVPGGGAAYTAGAAVSYGTATVPACLVLNFAIGAAGTTIAAGANTTIALNPNRFIGAYKVKRAPSVSFDVNPSGVVGRESYSVGAGGNDVWHESPEGDMVTGNSFDDIEITNTDAVAADFIIIGRLTL